MNREIDLSQWSLAVVQQSRPALETTVPEKLNFSHLSPEYISTYIHLGVNTQNSLIDPKQKECLEFWDNHSTW